MSDLEDFIRRSNPEAFERWTIWHQQSLLTQEQVVNQETRLMPTRAGFGGSALNGVFKFVWPLESGDGTPGRLDRHLIIERENAMDPKHNRYVLSLATWHFEFIKLTEDDLRIIQWPKSDDNEAFQKQRAWYKAKERIFEQWRWKRPDEDWK